MKNKLTNSGGRKESLKTMKKRRRNGTRPGPFRRSGFEKLEVRLLLTADFRDFAAGVHGPAVRDAVTDGSTGIRQPAESHSRVAEGESAPDLVAFAEALAEAGVKFYGAIWCELCNQQKSIFEDGRYFLPYIESTNPDRTLNENAIANGVNSFPTWDFPDPQMPGETNRVTGILSLEQIAQESGVPIPSSDAPSLAPIDDLTLLDYSPRYVSLNGYDPNGDPLTYTAESDNALVVPIVMQGNRSAVIDVSGFGPMLFYLFDEMAPRPSNRFAELATNDFYNNVIFHRVINDFVIQGGDPTGTGFGGSSLPDFDDQYHFDLQHNGTGFLSYAKSVDDTNDSQFFITEGPQRRLDFQHSIFGFLVEGDDTRDGISNTSVDQQDRPRSPVTMDSIDIFTDTENAVLQLLVMQPPGGSSGRQIGEANITVTASDGNDNFIQQSFRVVVEPDTAGSPNYGNGAPFLSDIGPVTTRVDLPVQIQLQANDVEGDPVVFGVLEQNPPGTTQVDATGVLTVTPPSGVTGDVRFKVRVRAANGSDTYDAWDNQLVTVHVVSDLTDFGDAPDSYLTLLAQNGARHLVGGPMLGSNVDGELEGQPTSQADGDDNYGATPDDDDGVRIIAPPIALSSGNSVASFSVFASSAGKLDAWIDFNANGSFDHPGEHLGGGESLDVVPGENVITYTTPSDAIAGETFARFRVSTAGELLPHGEADDGEVEDYLITVMGGGAGTIPLSVNLPTGPTRIETTDGDIVLLHNGSELLRAPGTALASVDVFDSDGTDVVTIGDLSAGLPSDNTLRLHTDIQDTLDLGVGWSISPHEFAADAFFRVLARGDVLLKLDGPAHWQNPLNPADTNGNGTIEPLDVLLLVNHINFGFDGFQPLPTPINSPIPYFDANGDGHLFADDVIFVINALHGEAIAIGEGELNRHALEDIRQPLRMWIALSETASLAAGWPTSVEQPTVVVAKVRQRQGPLVKRDSVNARISGNLVDPNSQIEQQTSIDNRGDLWKSEWREFPLRFSDSWTEMVDQLFTVLR